MHTHLLVAHISQHALLWRRMYLPGGHTCSGEGVYLPGGVPAQGGVPAGGVPAREGTCPGGVPA